MRALIGAATVACFAASGLVLGFCAGRFLGPLVLGAAGGHGLADLGYMFTGATLGALAGAALGIERVVTKSARGAWRPALVAAALAALAALVTYVIANAS